MKLRAIRRRVALSEDLARQLLGQQMEEGVVAGESGGESHCSQAGAARLRFAALMRLICSGARGEKTQLPLLSRSASMSRREAYRRTVSGDVSLCAHTAFRRRVGRSINVASYDDRGVRSRSHRLMSYWAAQNRTVKRRVSGRSALP